MYKYGQYCPVARATELLADRWTPLIIRELLEGIEHFNDLERGLPGISRGLLAERLRRLVQAGVVERRAGPHGRATAYRLTPAGHELHHVIDALGAWGARWAFGEPKPDESDPALLLWWMCRRINRDAVPPRRVVLQFEFRGARRGSYWLVVEPAGASVCLQHPGFDIDVLVTADLAGFYRLWLGRIGLAEAFRAGIVHLDGAPSLVRAFPGWFAWSPFAEAVRAASARPPSPARIIEV